MDRWNGKRAGFENQVTGPAKPGNHRGKAEKSSIRSPVAQLKTSSAALASSDADFSASSGMDKPRQILPWAARFRRVNLPVADEAPWTGSDAGF